MIASATRVGVLIKGRPSSSSASRDTATEEGESERWRKLVMEHQQYVVVDIQYDDN